MLCGDSPASPRSRQQDGRPMSPSPAADTEAHSGFESLAPLRPPVEKVLCFRGPVRTPGPGDIRGHPHLRGLEGPALWDCHGAADLGAQLVSGLVGSEAAPASPMLTGSGEEKPQQALLGGLPQGLREVGRGPAGATQPLPCRKATQGVGWAGPPREVAGLGLGVRGPTSPRPQSIIMSTPSLYAAPASRFHSAGPGQPRTPTHQPVTT